MISSGNTNRRYDMGNKAIEKAQRDAVKIAKLYGVDSSAVVWMGGNQYIVVIAGKETRVSV